MLLLSVVPKSESVYSLCVLSSGTFHCKQSVQRGQEDCERLLACHRVLALRGKSLGRSHPGRSLPSRLSAPHLRAARSTRRTSSKNIIIPIRHFLSGEHPCLHCSRLSLSPFATTESLPYQAGFHIGKATYSCCLVSE